MGINGKVGAKQGKTLENPFAIRLRALHSIPMRPSLFACFLVFGLVSALVACTKSADQARLKADFDHICAAQKDFLSAGKLKGVDEAELLVERMRRMREGLLADAAIRTADQLTQPGNPEMRALAEKEAAEAGLKDWTCPELATSR